MIGRLFEPCTSGGPCDQGGVRFSNHPGSVHSHYLRGWAVTEEELSDGTVVGMLIVQMLGVMVPVMLGGMQ